MKHAPAEDLIVDGAEGGESWFRRLTFFSLLAGLTPLIPAPYVDDWVLSRVRLRLGREILGLREVAASREELKTLMGVEKRDLWQGCVSTVVLLPIKTALYLLKKMIRKLVIVLTLKECSDKFSEVFHEGYLLHSAARRGDLGAESALDGAVAGAVRQGIVQACRQVDPRPIHQLVKRGLRGSRWLLMTGSRRLVALFRRGQENPEATEEGLRGEERLLSSLVDRLSRALWLQSGYWKNLEAHYLAAVENLRQSPDDAGSA